MTAAIPLHLETTDLTALLRSALHPLVEQAEEDGIGGSLLVHLAHDEVCRSVVLAVHDDGPGIPQETLPFLFERRRGKQHALGLALLLVRDVVFAHAGTIDVETRTGMEEHGTSINVVLPVRPTGPNATTS